MSTAPAPTILPSATPVPRLDDDPVVEVEGPEVVGQVHRPRGHAYVVPLAGRLRHQVDFVPVDLVPGQLLHLHPGQLLRWDAVPAGARALVVNADEPGGGREEWLPGQPPTVATFEPAAWRRVVDALRLLREEVARQGPAGEPDPEAVDALRRLFLARTRCARLSPARAVPGLNPYLAFRRVMERHLGEITQVGELARLAGYSLTTVSRACVRATGLSAKELLDERTMLEAQRLLCTTPLTVADVATRLGYREPTNFTRAFRRVTGQSPSEAREPARSRA